MVVNDSAGLAADLIERLGRYLAAAENMSPLKPVQWEALRYFACANQFSNTPGALSLYLAATKGTVSQTVKALEEKGLVTKVTHPETRRSVAVALTPAGHAMLEDDPLQRLEKAVRAAGVGSELAETLSQVIRNLQEAHGFHTFGICRTCRFFEPSKGAGGGPRCGLLEVDLKDDETKKLCVEHEPKAA